MEIQINDISYKYISDFPSGWLNKSHDYYKYPVNVDSYALFVKRFENPPLAFELLRKYKDGIRIEGIPAIYAFLYSGKEECFYLFQEYIKAEELKQRLKGILSFDLKTYAATIYGALNFLHEEGFWHTDFMEENIMIDADKKFYLIDIDSCLPLSEVSSTDNIKDASFSADVFINLKRLKPDFSYENIDGKQLNILQLIFSMVHFYNFTYNRGPYSYWEFSKQYTFDNISSLVPFLDDLLLKALDYKLSYVDVERVIDYLESMNGTKILLTDQPSDKYSNTTTIITVPEEEDKEEEEVGSPSSTIVEVPSTPSIPLSLPHKKPTIQSWEINGQKRHRFTTETGEKYTLSWTVLNANYVELDGELLSANPPIKHLASTKNKTHYLSAINRHNDEEIRSEAISIRVKVVPRAPRKTDPRLIYFEVDGHSSSFRALPNTRVSIKWKVENVDHVVVNNLKNPPQGQFSKVLDTPYVFTLEAEGISRQVIRVGLLKEKTVQAPQIESFSINGLKSDKIITASGENLNIAWETAFAEKISLYYDGMELISDDKTPQKGLYTFPINTQTIKKRQSKELKLLAFSDDKEVVLIKQVVLQPEKNNRLLFVFLLLLLIAALILILQLNF